jgi:hypothetical protein
MLLPLISILLIMPTPFLIPSNSGGINSAHSTPHHQSRLVSHPMRNMSGGDVLARGLAIFLLII